MWWQVLGRINMKTTREEIQSWIRRQEKKSQPSVVYIRWLEQQRIRVTTQAEVKKCQKSR